MAYDKIIPIRNRLDRCLNYVLNDGKTALGRALEYIEDQEKTALEWDGGTVRLETALNCELDSARKDMEATKRRWGKDGPGHVLGYIPWRLGTG